jgi:hypothetical protein
VQAVDEEHDTDLSSAANAPLGPCNSDIVQDLPFHRAVRSAPLDADPYDPTAVHEVVDGQETAFKGPIARVVGVVAIVHVLPFHTSISGTTLRLASCVPPTAIHRFEDGQATPASIG